MKIDSLRIDGYGRLAQREIGLNEGVTVLFGRNEAGKSTTLQFIRAMLYGIPGRGIRLNGTSRCKEGRTAGCWKQRMSPAHYGLSAGMHPAARGRAVQRSCILHSAIRMAVRRS